MLEKPNLQNVVKALLKNRTQKELQALTGVSQSTISSLKNGKGKKQISYDNAFALINALAKDQNQT